jgi:hypothetical protein
VPDPDGEDLVAVRTVSIAPERLPVWLDIFASRHGPCTFAATAEAVAVSAADGAEARLRPPFVPLPTADLPAAFLDHVARDRTVAALLVRKGGVAVGVFRGRALLESKIESGYVQGRTKAGGWSQQRYARRRQHQAEQVHAGAADLAVRIVLPRLDALDAVALGGDKSATAAVLADPRLAPLRPLILPRTYPVADPRLVVLQTFPDQFLAIAVELNALA